MPENILVVEYEPRYTDRVKAALNGQSYSTAFAKDGEEAIRALEGSHPRLIVLSSVIPKISATDLIRQIRERKNLEDVPILLTVSGYTGNTPRQDAARLGASDILPKPYSETDLLAKVTQMLGAEHKMTSDEIFGDVLDDEKPAPVPQARRSSASADVDKMLEETLAGVRSVRKPAAKSNATIDKMVHDTLSGLEKSARRVAPAAPAAAPPPAPTPAAPPVAAKPAPAPAAQQPAPAASPAAVPAAPAAVQQAASAPAPVAAMPVVEKIPLSQPVFPSQPVVEAQPEEEPTDGLRFGQYVLLEKIATGGMAEVWKARMRGVEGFQKIVAIKKILPHLSNDQDFIEMFVDEAKLAAQLNHNNIIHIYDLGKIQSSYYIAMEYVEGHDLKTILRRGEERGQPVGVELSLFISSKIAAALDYAHRRRDFEEKEMGLVHRDVSPQNVLISQEGDIKLCDFGIAKAASKGSHTQAGALKGKLQYMSPEQAWGRQIDRRSDVFALGAVLYEMLTGVKLFTGDNEMSILEQVREARVEPPSSVNDEVTPEIDAIVLRALKKEPTERYQTAGDMARDLDSVLYQLRPTPTSADLAIYMHRIWSPEPELPPVVEEAEPEAVTAVDIRSIGKPAPPAAAPAAPPRAAAAPVAAAAAAAAAAGAGASVVMPPWEGAALGTPVLSAPPRKRSAAGPIAIVFILIAGIVGAFLFVRSRGASEPAPDTATAQQAAVVTAAPATTVPSTTMPVLDTAATIAPVPGTVAPQQPSLDPAMVAQEVQRRLAAERARLDQQNSRTPAADNAPQVARETQPPATQPPLTQPPATQTVAPPTESAAVEPAPAPAQTAAAPAQPAAETAPAPVRARYGELIPAGTPGLIPPRVLRRGSVPYPMAARAQRVEGKIEVTVLVSETGQVLDARVVRGVSRSVGLNEAAIQMMRRSEFAPGMKDGVRVKAWTVVPVDFKL